MPFANVFEHQTSDNELDSDSVEIASEEENNDKPQPLTPNGGHLFSKSCLVATKRFQTRSVKTFENQQQSCLHLDQWLGLLVDSNTNHSNMNGL